MVNADKSLHKQFIICCLANLVLFFAMLMVDRLYIDDMGRSISGDFGWTECGRPLADVIVYLVNLGGPLVNIAPLPQLISIVIIALASVELINMYKMDNIYLAALCTLPLAGQPYFMENMSYGFDSPTMALAMLFSVYAAKHIRKGDVTGKLIATLCILCTLMTYQAALSVFFVTCMYLLLNDIKANENPLKFILSKIAVIVISTITAVMAYLPISRMRLNEYAKAHSETIAFDNILTGLYLNAAKYITIIFDDWQSNYIGWLGLIVVISAFVAIGFSLVEAKCNNYTKIVYWLILLLSLPIILVASYFPQILLIDPVFSPRTFIGLGAVLSLSCLQFTACFIGRSSADTLLYRLGYYMPVCLLAYALMVFSYSFARANSSQKDYEHYFLTRLISDTDEILLNHKIYSISFIGTINRSKLVQNSMRKFPLLGRLVPLHISDNWPWGLIQLKTMGLSRYPAALTKDDIDKTETASPVASKSLYKMFILGDKLIIKFNNRS